MNISTREKKKVFKMDIITNIMNKRFVKLTSFS